MIPADSDENTNNDPPTTIVIFSFFSPIFIAFHVFICLMYFTFKKYCSTKLHDTNKHDQSCQTEDTTTTNNVIVVVHPDTDIINMALATNI